MTTPTHPIMGSTGGIGRVLCERLAQFGDSFVLAGRDPEHPNERAAARQGGRIGTS